MKLLLLLSLLFVASLPVNADTSLYERGKDLIEENDGEFKTSLDRYKYVSRYDGANAVVERDKASQFIAKLEARLEKQDWLLGDRKSLADMSILPFTRQFAHVDLEWFNGQDWPNVIGWLNRFKSSESFAEIMKKYPQWQANDAVTLFP